MENWLTDIMNEFGYIGITALIAFENIFPPIPSEVILTFGGFLTTSTSLSIFGVIAASTAGSVVGAIVLYIIGLQLDVSRLEKVIDRWGRYLRITKDDLYRADAWFDKYGVWTVFFCRFVPLIRSLISVPAGMSNMNVGLFLLFTSLGTIIWNSVLVILGASVGESWEVIIEYMEVYSKVIYVGLIVLTVFLLYILLKRK
ncbi:membrane protein DedA, SNARE-associated domain [Oceanobacillus limi]|uniref:Membrane protein DedA, SNARE-associated domain n=1 Tax=Oceanobacillus limi TaxID=930131 RepID=A0A1I0CFS3_9BACI|nr:DedA family protein [Oceanobacillus limi]SET17972.1 membrane protein DedA, SNARE-associated domain [Oceanobacillus limi]